MNLRHLLAAPLLATAVVGPYLASDGDGPQVSPSAAEAGRDDLALPAPHPGDLAGAPLGDVKAVSPSLSPAPSGDGIPPFDASRARLAGAPVSDFSEVIRFDVTPEWIFTRWSRVTTITADQDLKGFRAPLVTGTRVDDVAGVVTYYFGRHGRLQRLGFEGNTGDTRRLVSYLTQNFGFQPHPSLGAGLYLVTWNAKPMSGLRIDYAPVVRADAPHLRYTLKLEINRADEGYQMSEEFHQILGYDRQTKRWVPYP